jgi:subtilisin family serine protease
LNWTVLLLISVVGEAELRAKYHNVGWAVALFMAVCLLGKGNSAVNAGGTTQVHVVSRKDWAGQPKYKPGEVLVRFRPGVPKQTIDRAHAVLGAQVARGWASVEGLQLVRLPAGLKLREAIRNYRANPNVLYAEPNYIVHALGIPNDPMFPQMWNLHNTGQDGGTVGADIHATQAWGLSTGSSSVVVAVIDTGIDYNHQDLAANVWSNPSAFSGTLNGIGINCAAGTHGFNTITNTCDPLDDNAHGSHVSGTIGATGNNGVGVVGVNWAVQIMACKFLDANGGGNLSDAITCLDFVKAMKDRGVNVIATNNSWGGGAFSQALADAIQAQQQDGILFIAAAGNDFVDNDIAPFYPADYFFPNLVAVAATSRFDELAAFSDLGRHSVSLGAPGQEILSTTPNNTYSVFSGTSMAAPHVTGVAALLASQNPSRDWRSIKNLILASGDTIPALAQTITGKRLDAFGAMSCTNSTVTQRLQPSLDSIPGAVGKPITLAVLNINCSVPASSVQVTVSPGSQTITLLDNGTGADLAAGDGIFSGQWSPPALGDYSLAFPNGDVVQVTVLSNYTVGETSFSYNTIAGSNLNLGDDDVATLNSPFPVQFGGGSFSKLYVSSNGTISFTNAFDDFINGPLPLNFAASQNPQNSPPPNIDIPVVTLVAPLWQDLYPVKGTNKNVFWQVTGSDPNRQLVIEWRNVLTYDCRSDSNANVTFEAVFSEGSSNFTFNYSNVVFGGLCSDEDRGAAATIGTQITQDAGIEWSGDQQAVGNGMSLLFTVAPANPTSNPAPTLTSVTPSSIPAGSGDTTITLTGTGFVPSSEVITPFNFRYVSTYVSSTQLQVLLPAATFSSIAGGTIQLNVTNPTPGGGTSQSATVTVVGQPPQITSISPSTVPAGSFGFVLTINGSNFFPGSDVVWNGTGGQSTFVNSNQLNFAVPGYLVANPGTVPVQVQNTASTFSNTVTFTITPATTPGAIAAPPPISPELPDSPHSPATTTSGSKYLPTRFPGWKYAAQRGTEFMSQFLRRRGGLAPPSSVSLPNGNAQIQAGSPTPPFPGFNFRPALPADFLPTAVVTGDFNGDGHMDWAVANGGSNNIWIFLGRGDGTAQLPTIIPLKGAAPVALATADMNHDGKLDLVVAEADSGSVGILLGNGDGTFAAEREVYVPGGPESLAVADFNGDGNPDVVVGLFGDINTGQLAFLPGDGTGKLGLPVTHFGQINDLLFDTFYIVAADLNGDGLPDIVALDYSVAPIGGISISDQRDNAGARVYLNQGNGIFKESQQFFFDISVDQEVGLGTAATAIALGDVNKDGCIDAVVFDTEDVATYFPGKCDGTFDVSNSRIFGTGIVAGAATLVDVNGDGKLDIVSSAFPFATDPEFFSSMGNSLSVMLGDGTGNFSSPSIFRGEPGMFSIAVADLNGDGHPDVVSANQGTDSVSVYLNDGSGGFGGPSGGYLGYLAGGQMHAVFDSPSTGFALMDVNHDGHKDLVLLESGPQFPLPFQLAVHLGDATGKFGAAIRSPILDIGSNQAIEDFALADFRNTGTPDLLLLGVEGTPSQPNPAPFFAYAKNNGDGTFQKPVLTSLSNMFPLHFVVGDFNGDGKLDIIFVNVSSNPNGNTPIASLIPFFGKGDGTFTQGTSVLFTSSNAAFFNQVFAADVNHDGKLDLLVVGNGLLSASDQNAVYEVIGNGDGTFQTPKLLFSNPGSTSYFAVADLNKDGIPDLVEEAVNNGIVDGAIPRTFRTYLGRPDGTYQLNGTFGPFSNQFASALLFGAPDKPLWPLQPTVADFNGDGNLDIAVLAVIPGGSFNAFGIAGGAVGTTMEILAGNGDGTFTLSNLGFNFGTVVAPQVAADVNGDNRADLIELDGYSSSFDVLTAQPGPSFGLNLVSSPVIGTTGTLRIMLAFPSVAATTLQLSASDPSITIPSSTTIPAGSVSQDINFQIGSGFNTNHVFALTGQVGSEAHSAYGTEALSSANVGFIAVPFGGPPLTPPVVAATQTVTYQVVIASLGGYATQIRPSCQGLPSGADCQFGSTPIPLPAGQVLTVPVTITTQANTPVGVYTPMAIFTDGFVTQQVSMPFNVGDFTMSLTPSSETLGTTDFTTYTLMLGSVDSYALAVQLTCSGLPSGVICPVNGQLDAPGPQGVFFQIHTQNTTPGTYAFVITGTSGPLTHNTSAQLIVTSGSFSGSVSPGSATIPVGSSHAFNIMVNPLNGFNGNVSLACPSPPSGINCQFNPSQVAVGANNAGTSALTVSVNAKPNPAVARRAANHAPFLPPSQLLLMAESLGALAALSMCAIRFGRRIGKRRLRYGAFATAVLAVCLVAGLSSCGGGGGGGGGGGNPVTVNLTIQASAGQTSVTIGTVSVTVP